MSTKNNHYRQRTMRCQQLSDTATSASHAQAVTAMTVIQTCQKYCKGGVKLADKHEEQPSSHAADIIHFVGREEVPGVPDCSSILLAGRPFPFPAARYISDMSAAEMKLCKLKVLTPA